METRAFRPGYNLHTFRSFGNLFGLLLVRSLDRSERVLAAMKCRGFQGRFYILHAFAWMRRDTVFSVCAAAGVVLIVSLEIFR
jgi:cobalt/nickel transport system permease protein